MENRLFLMSVYRNGTDGISVSSCFACYAPFRRGINSDTYLETEEMFLPRKWLNLAESKTPGNCMLWQAEEGSEKVT